MSMTFKLTVNCGNDAFTDPRDGAVTTDELRAAALENLKTEGC